MIKNTIEFSANVYLIARERGKRVPKLCHEGHNVWVNLGRQYLAEVVSPLNSSFNAHYADSPVRVVRYVGLGIGSHNQLVDIPSVYPTLNADYPGQNTFTDISLMTNCLERPVKVTGTAGGGTAPGVWMSSVGAPPVFSSDPGPGTPTTRVKYTTLFTYTDINLAGAYASVPLSEVALFLSSVQSSRLSNEVYNYTGPPDYIGASRQHPIAYHAFDTISKTVSVNYEVVWELQF
jgi:hypothetical protein